MWCWHKRRHRDHWNTIENPKINPNICGQLTFNNNGAKGPLNGYDAKAGKNPVKMVGAERGHQRAYRLKPQSQTTSQSDHTDHSVVQLSETKPCCVGPPKMDGSWWR